VGFFSLPDFIERRRNRWYAVWDVPKDCRKAFAGKDRMVLSLQTESRSEAIIRARRLVEEWKLIAEKSRGAMEDKIAARAAFFRHHLERAKSAQEREEIEHVLHDEIDWHRLGGEDDDDPNSDANRLYGLATGRLTEIKLLIEPWLAARQVEPRTKLMDRTVLELLVSHYPTVQEIDRKKASQFVERVLSTNRSPATVRRMLSGLNGFWKWLQRRGEWPENQRSPWSEQAPPKPRKRGSFATTSEDRRPFTEAEASAFIAAVMATKVKHPADGLVVMLMAVTGARLEEVCGLDGGDVEVGSEVAWLTIREGKTAAASRRIPVVAPVVVEALRNRLPSAPFLPLFPEYPLDRYRKRSKPVSQRLGRLLRKAVQDERVVAAHGWRHRGRDLAEKNGVEPWVADWFFGHARPGEGLARYSKGPSEADLLRVAHALPLPTFGGEA
jgi:integrase